MSIARTIVVLVVAAVLAALAWIGSTGPEAGTAATPGGVERLISRERLPIDEVDRIELRRGDGPPLVMTREGDQWWQVQPFRHRLMPFSARQLVTQTLDLQVLDAFGPDQLTGALSLDALSLDPPLASVSFRGPEGTLTVHCGRTGLAGRAYARVEGDPAVYVVGQELHERAVEADVREWRDRQLFVAAGIDSERIELDDGAQRVVLVRDGRRWTMLEPARTRVDPVVRDALVQALGRATSHGYVLDRPDDLARFGLSEPQGEVVVTTGQVVERDGQVERRAVTTRLLVGGRIGGSQDRFAMIDGTPAVFRLPAETIVALFRDPRELADPTAAGAQSADVKTMIIRSQDAPELVLERDLDRWLARTAGSADGGIEVQPALVEELLNQLTEVRATTVQLQPYPRELEVATVTLLGFDQRPLDTVRIARDPDTREWGLENGDDVIRVFPESVELRLTREALGLE